MRTTSTIVKVIFSLVLVLLVASSADARNPIRRSFFNTYPSANDSTLDDLPSNVGHCGVCHYDFDGGGPRNWYGVAIEVARGIFPDDESAILSIENEDSDGDGFSNLTEITSLLFDNTPTFPGLTGPDTSLVSNVDMVDIRNYLTPAGGSDTTPPTVTVHIPAGGEIWDANSTNAVTWTASDASGIEFVDIWQSDDGGLTFKQVAAKEPDDGTFDWFVPNRPGGSNIMRVVARDSVGNYGSGLSGTFSVTGAPAGTVPTTMRDVDFAGSQPFEANTFEDPDVNCITCHGEYNYLVEPWYQWKGSMMAQAQRDPLFLATVV
ncbi:MAG: hypothetical protein KAJ17_14285, partial [Candidatus Krumholzibacteria bacterium]|nr:hypothetical protein [Candidatus Krumholzibacteria bacterium]